MDEFEQRFNAAQAAARDKVGTQAEQHREMQEARLKFASDWTTGLKRVVDDALAGTMMFGEPGNATNPSSGSNMEFTYKRHGARFSLTVRGALAISEGYRYINPSAAWPNGVQPPSAFERSQIETRKPNRPEYIGVFAYVTAVDSTTSKQASVAVPYALLQNAPPIPILQAQDVKAAIL